MIHKSLFSRCRKSIFEGDNYVGRFSKIINCQIGRMSYVGSNCFFIDTKIGKFCSIASNVKLVFGKHPTRKFVSTHPAFYSTISPVSKTFVDKTIFDEYGYVLSEGKQYRLIIGNDVWIGSDVILLEGITIGDGAIIAAGSVVTKNVGDYEIVGGCPAKPIRTRFDDETIIKIRESRWWDHSDEWLVKHASLFENSELFLENLEETNE